jgi:hypothetical protein
LSPDGTTPSVLICIKDLRNIIYLL